MHQHVQNVPARPNGVHHSIFEHIGVQNGVHHIPGEKGVVQPLLSRTFCDPESWPPSELIGSTRPSELNGSTRVLAPAWAALHAIMWVLKRQISWLLVPLTREVPGDACRFRFHFRGGPSTLRHMGIVICILGCFTNERPVLFRCCTVGGRCLSYVVLKLLQALQNLNQHLSTLITATKQMAAV